jgi:predicted dehydrogenase
MTNSATRILVVGVGSIGERHLRCFGLEGGCRLGLVEPLESRRNDVADRYDVADRFASLDDACRHEWDAAVICTPANLHVAHAVQLAPRCRGLMIEKPLATDLAEVPKLRVAVAGKPVQIAYIYRVHPAVEAARKLITEGTIGNVLQITLRSAQDFPRFRPAYREIYYADRRTGGGAIQDAATHMADLAQHLVGRFDWVFCDYGHQALEGVTVEDTVHLAARANGGKVLVSLSLNQFSPGSETRVQVNGALGSVQIRLPEHQYGVLLRGKNDDAWQWSEPLLTDRDEWFRRQARRFLEVLAGRAEPSCTLDEAAHTLAINRAALESAGVNRVEIGAAV